MILISLCLSLGLLNLFSYLIQWIFKPLLNYHQSCLLYTSSHFFVVIQLMLNDQEAYELNYINSQELQHLLSIASFASISFIFVSLHLEYPLIIYFCHLAPSIIKALFYHQHYEFQSLKESIIRLKKPHVSFVEALKQSILSSCYAFIFILGYMLVFQFVGYAIGHIIKDSFINAIIQGVLEFSSGSLQLLQFSHTPLVYSLICFNLSFSGLSVMMQTDNLLDGIDYSFKAYFKARLFHGLCSFTLCLLILTYLL